MPSIWSLQPSEIQGSSQQRFQLASRFSFLRHACGILYYIPGLQVPILRRLEGEMARSGLFAPVRRRRSSVALARLHDSHGELIFLVATGAFISIRGREDLSIASNGFFLHCLTCLHHQVLIFPVGITVFFAMLRK